MSLKLKNSLFSIPNNETLRPDASVFNSTTVDDKLCSFGKEADKKRFE